MTSTSSIRTGGEIDAFCSKCELNLAHTIVAMVGPKVIKVKCNTCGNDHQYRGEQPLVKSTSFANPKRGSSAAKPRVPKAEKAAIAWEDKFKGKDLTRARKYSVKETFAVDDVIDHPTFGLGLVNAVRGDKVDVSFKQEEKTLAHGKGGPPAAAPAPASEPVTVAPSAPATDSTPEA